MNIFSLNYSPKIAVALSLAIGFLTFASAAIAQAEATRFKRVLWTDKSGCAKANFSDEEKVKIQVSCDSFLQDGSKVKVVNVDNLTVAVIIGDDGDYLIMDTFIGNKSDARINVDPTHSSVFVWKTKDIKETPERFAPISGEQIAKKIRTRIAWANALGAIGAGTQTQTATVDTTSTGTVMVQDNRGNSATGVYTGTAQSTVTMPNTQAQVQEAIRARERTANANSVGGFYVANGLRANTLFPNQSVSGMIYFKRKKSPMMTFTIEVNDILFDFVFSNQK